jgi:hypothetical protein
MSKLKSNNSIDSLYAELQEEDRKYGGNKRLEKPQSEVSKKRPLKNLKKAWMEHTEDFDEVDDFYEH